MPNRVQCHARMNFAEVRRWKTKVNAQSRMDFLNKLNIALKEADETEYWLDLLHETKYIDENMILKKDLTFTSASQAASFVLFASTNGLTSWMDAAGTTLKALQG